MAEKFKAKVGGGPTGGTFNTFANAMAVYVPKHLEDVKVSAVGSGGSVENVKRVSSGESDFGLCYAVDSALGRGGMLPKDENKYDGTRPWASFTAPRPSWSSAPTVSSRPPRT